MKRPVRNMMLAVALPATLLALTLLPAGAADQAAGDPALQRTRKQVRMLDDLYKGMIVTVTENYVHDDKDLAAGDAFQAIFKVMNDKGYHQVRLLDGTGQPYDDDNTPRKGFEQKAVKAIVGGEGWYEEESQQDGKRVLHVATAVPVVMKKCIMCHEHYADVPEGKAIGALSYTIEIE